MPRFAHRAKSAGRARIATAAFTAELPPITRPHDRGVAMFRRLLKRGIEAVQRGEDPAELAPEIVDRPLPSFATDRVVPISMFEGNPDGPEVLRGIGRKLAQEYLQCPPMSLLK